MCNRKWNWAMLLVCSLALSSGGCVITCGSPAVWQTEEANLSQAASGVEQVEVETHNGAITFTAVEGTDGIAILVTKKAGGANVEDAASCMEAIAIDAAVEGGTYKLGWHWAGLKKSGWQGKVSFEISLPASIDVSGTTHNGGIAVSDMACAARLRTHNGGVTVENHQGQVDAETHNGGISAGSVCSDIRLATHNGGIKCDLSGCEAINGELTTHNGSITVELGDKASAEIVCTTNNGSVSCTCPMDVTVKKKHVLVGKVGEGGGKLEVETHNGSISVK